MFNIDKKCPHCFGRIKIRMEIYFMLLGFSFLLFIAYFYLFYNFQKFFYEQRGIFPIIIIFSLSYGAMIYTGIFLSKILNLRIFIAKDNVENHIKSRQSYLK